uniref:Uncharacterized protein n=1 Tax=Octopus bimaculoides TaxID=37653 RepID=A0A0L8GU88_OCTBM
MLSLVERGCSRCVCRLWKGRVWEKLVVSAGWGFSMIGLEWLSTPPPPSFPIHIHVTLVFSLL